MYVHYASLKSIHTIYILSENRRICVNNFKILKLGIGSAIAYFHIAKLSNEENVSKSRHQQTTTYILIQHQTITNKHR